MKELLFCVLEILSHGSKAKECHRHPRAVTAAYAIQEAHREYPSVPAPILAAVIAHESGFDPKATGALGEIGLLQIKRGGAVSGPLATMSTSVLYNPRVNVLVGARYLSLMQRKCRSTAGWLSAYNGRRGCTSSPYSDKVLVLLRSKR